VRGPDSIYPLLDRYVNIIFEKAIHTLRSVHIGPCGKTLVENGERVVKRLLKSPFPCRAANRWGEGRVWGKFSGRAQGKRSLQANAKCR